MKDQPMGQPMGGFGVATEIVSGKPYKPKSTEEREAEQDLKESQAIREVAQLANELPLVLHLMASQLEGRLRTLMDQDGPCQGILQMIAAFNMKIGVAPNVIAKIRRQSFGTHLTQMTDETKVAPFDPFSEEGDTGLAK